jgi:hypothetical protein
MHTEIDSLSLQELRRLHAERELKRHAKRHAGHHGKLVRKRRVKSAAERESRKRNRP